MSPPLKKKKILFAIKSVAPGVSKKKRTEMRVLSPRFCSDNPLSSSVSRLARLSNLLSFFFILFSSFFFLLLTNSRASLKLPSKKRNSSLSHHHPLLRSADFFVSSHKHQHQSFPVISSPKRGETGARSLRGRAPPLRSDEGKKEKTGLYPELLSESRGDVCRSPPLATLTATERSVRLFLHPAGTEMMPSSAPR